MSASQSTPLQRALMCLRLAYENRFPHESETAFRKCCEILKRNHLLPHLTMRSTDQIMFLSLAAQYPDLAYGLREEQQEQPKYEQAKSRQKRQAKPGTTRVNQSGLEREVPDKEWHNMTCSYCKADFTYESYPGNPRRYCSPECKKKATNIEAAWRMRQRRAAKTS